jgi:hypothetical protein
MILPSQVAGVHYPGNLATVRSWFPADTACLDYLDWLRWPDGFCCPHCGAKKGWRLPAGGWSCGGCRRRVRVLADTAFQDTRTPLTVLFKAAWLMAATKNGVSATSLHPLLGLGSYRTAWGMCHKQNQAKDPEARRGEGKGRVSAWRSPCPAAHAEEGRRLLRWYRQEPSRKRGPQGPLGAAPLGLRSPRRCSPGCPATICLSPPTRLSPDTSRRSAARRGGRRP